MIRDIPDKGVQSWMLKNGEQTNWVPGRWQVIPGGENSMSAWERKPGTCVGLLVPRTPCGAAVSVWVCKAEVGGGSGAEQGRLSLEGLGAHPWLCGE